MKITELLNEGTLTIDDLLTPDEQEIVASAIQGGKSIEKYQQVVEQKLRNMGMNVQLNIGTFLKWAHQIDRQANPQKFETPGVDEVGKAWASYGDARRRGEI